MNKVYLAFPRHNRLVDIGAAQSIFATPRSERNRHRYEMITGGKGTSLLPYTFNMLLNEALNNGATHFAMLHSDIAPEPAWLDKLYDKLEEMSADVVSVVVPIKTPQGLTSTAIGSIDDEWTVLKRLTMREVVKLPETFTAADAGFPGHPLLINTGCWLADLRKPIWTATDDHGVADFAFDFRNRRVLCADGTWDQD